jgi:hypothetical protein
MAAEATPLTEGAKKVLDESNENACGFCALQVLDQDGYVKKTKGSQIEAPFHVTTTADSILLEAQFPLSPLFFLQLLNEEGNFIFGRWWLGDAKWSRTNQLCSLIPKDVQVLHRGDISEFVVDAEIPFIKDAPSRLAKVAFSTKEQKFVTKVTKVVVTIPKDAWDEWKQYRMKLWRSSKTWAGEDKDEKEDDKDKKEGGDKDAKKGDKEGDKKDDKAKDKDAKGKSGKK